MSLSAGELITLRVIQQSTELYLALVKPNTVFSAQINNASATKGLANLNYDNASGNLANVRKGQTVYVGTGVGKSDKGRVRVRSVVTGTINVAVDNSIEYLDNDYLTIRQFHEFWPVFPRATVNDSNIVTFYKDYDIPYSNQNSLLTPIPVMGCDYAGFVSVTGSQSVYFTASGSYVSDGSAIGTYQWLFPTGCVPSSYGGVTPGNVVFPSAGTYNVELSVMSNTKTGTAFRNIVLLNRPGTATTNLPILDWQLDDITGDWNNGWTAKINVGDRANEFEDGYMVIIFAEDKYGSSSQSIGGYPGREQVKFIGYINKADTNYDWQTSRTTFLLKGISSLFQNKEMFSVSLESNAAPNVWTQLKDMTINTIVDHYVRWHSTLLEVVDYTQVQTTEGTYRDHYEDVPKGEIANTVNNVLGSRLLANFCSDRQNRCFSQVDLNLLPTGTRPSTALILTDNDWINEAKYGENLESSLSTVLLGGVSFNGTDDTGLLSRAPGTFPGYTGKSQNVSGLALSSQDQLNILSGLYYGKYKNRIPEFTLQLANNFGQADVIPQEYWEYSLSTGRTTRGTEWINKRFIPRKVSEKWADGVLSQNITFESETNASPGVTVLIPVTPPPATRPRIGRITRPPTAGRRAGGTNVSGNVMFCIAGASLPGQSEDNNDFQGNYVIRTTNFLASYPTWYDITNNATGKPLCLRLDPWNPKNRAYLTTTTGIWVSSNISASASLVTWTNRLTLAQMLAATPATVQAFTYNGICSPNDNGYFGIITDDFDSTSNSRLYFGRTSNIDGGSGTWSWTLINSGLGTLFRRRPRLWIGQHSTDLVIVSIGYPTYYSNNGGTSFTAMSDYRGILGCDAGSVPGMNIFIPFSTNDNTIILSSNSGHPAGAGTIITSGGVGGTFSLLDTGGCDSLEGLTESPSTAGGETYMLDTTNNRLRKRSGASMVTVGTLPGDLLASRGAGFGGWPYNNFQVQVSSPGKIWRSEDGGLTWIDKTGNANTYLAGAYGTYLVPIWIP